MKQPVLKDDAFLADVMTARQDLENLYLWWLGQSGFLLQWQNHHMLLDPYLSDSLTHKYAKTDQPHIRMTERVIAPERLNFIDVVISSHSHTDHLDKETLVPLMRINPNLQLLVPEANRGVAADRLEQMLEYPRGINAGGSKQIGVFRINAVPAAHPKIEKDEWGQHKYLGYVIECGPWKIYHSGDTMLYDDIIAQLTVWPIDVALLPINGDKPERRVAGNLNGREAATLARDIGARLVIPCHYDMFEFNTVSPDEFRARAEEINQPCRILRVGERWSSLEMPNRKRSR